MRIMQPVQDAFMVLLAVIGVVLAGWFAVVQFITGWSWRNRDLPVWQAVGFEPAEARMWARDCFTPKTATAWRSAGFDAPAARGWRHHGYEPGEAARWAFAKADDRDFRARTMMEAASIPAGGPEALAQMLEQGRGYGLRIDKFHQQPDASV
jgi:hypothetical protein